MTGNIERDIGGLLIAVDRATHAHDRMEAKIDRILESFSAHVQDVDRRFAVVNERFAAEEAARATRVRGAKIAAAIASLFSGVVGAVATRWFGGHG